jgi:hypothetical protein
MQDMPPNPERKAPLKKKTEVTAPKFFVLNITIKGSPGSPLVIHNFSEKARQIMRSRQEAGSTAVKSRARDAKDFQQVFENARHISRDGWDGYPAGGIRNCLIDACKLVGFAMTRAKLSIFVIADGIDRDNGMPLVRIYGDAQYSEHNTRNESGVADIRARPMFNEWHANLRIKFDSGQFTPEDVLNLLIRAGGQCGLGEGRPNSKKSNGLGWGLFDIDRESPISLDQIDTPKFDIQT